MRSYAGFATRTATVPIEVLAQLGFRFRRPTKKTFRAVSQRLDPADLDGRIRRLFHRAGWAAPRFPDCGFASIYAAICEFRYSVRTSCGVR